MHTGFPNNFTTCSTQNPKSRENCYYICGKALKPTKIFSEENAEKHKALLLVFTQSIYFKTMHTLWLRRNVFCKSTSNYSMNSLHTIAPLFKEILTLHQTSLTHQVPAIPKNTTPILKLALMNSRNHVLTQAQSDVYLFESLQTIRVLIHLYCYIHTFRIFLSWQGINSLLFVSIISIWKFLVLLGACSQRLYFAFAASTILHLA